jgi:hypothetical protein
MEKIMNALSKLFFVIKRFHFSASAFLGLLTLSFVSVPGSVSGQQSRLWGGEILTPLGGGEFQSAKFGMVSIQGNAATSNSAWVPGLGSFAEASGQGLWTSYDFGEIQRGNEDPGWLLSSRFGWTHFAPNAEGYGGWVWTERFEWMKFEDGGGQRFLWAPMINSWLAVQQDGTFFSFQFRLLRPTGLRHYQSDIFGNLTAGDFGGWVSSDRFGWLWANGDGTWFWSESWEEWLGLTEGGGLWSTARGRFITPNDQGKYVPPPQGGCQGRFDIHRVLPITSYEELVTLFNDEDRAIFGEYLEGEGPPFSSVGEFLSEYPGFPDPANGITMFEIDEFILKVERPEFSAAQRQSFYDVFWSFNGQGIYEHPISGNDGPSLETEIETANILRSFYCSRFPGFFIP